MNYSKEAIAEAFLELLDEQPFNKITVRDIVERCGVNRNTFYYHFQDIPSLLEEILTARIDELIEKHCKIGSLEDCISIAVNYFVENKRAVLQVYRSLPRDVFIQHLNRMLLYLARGYLDNIARTIPMRSDDQELLTRFFKCLLVGVFLDWLDSGMSFDLLADAMRVCQLQGDASIQLLLNAAKPDTH